MKKFFASLNWKYITFITVFLIICLELFGRVYLSFVLKKSSKPKFQFDSYRIYSHIPNFKEGDGKKDWILINGQGFRRSTEVSKVKPAGTFRVFFMGGSAAHGISSAPPYPLVHIYMNETVDYYLEQKLKALHPGKKIEVINAAVTGYQVFQHTAYLLSELLNYSPDLVVFMDGANDHYFTNPEFDYMGSNRYQFWKPRLQQPSIGGWFTYGWLWLSKYSGFARGVYSWMLNNDASSYDKLSIRSGKDFTSDAELIAAHKKTAQQDFLRAIEANLLILKANGVESIVSLQPMLVLRNKTNLSSAEKAFLHTDEAIQKLYPQVLAYLKTLSNKYQVPFVDLNPAFNTPALSQKQLLIDYCHLSPLGGETVANALLPSVDSIFVKSKPNLN
ncbi:MAG TPA: GDSL-type esterase/lipase family protein [Bacteroidia bacterium]|nr:GDSL-type esterase/lipase family protein [Bacteroidia bacterium]HRH08976.1 GDSL-type esterase/lipase family protein [Bacteroidia bacterium]